MECCLVHAVCWRGLLPAQTTFAELEAIWELSCYATAYHPAARIFTGPYPVAPQTTVQACFARDDLPKFRSQDGSALVLTVMPSFSGGGAKDDKIQLAKSRIAKACLEQGVTLPDVNRIGAQLTQQVPLAKLVQALDAQPQAEQWLQLQALMQAHGIKAPTAAEVSSRLAQKVQSQLSKKNLFQQTLTAEDFSLCGGFFVNEDGTPTNVLTKLVPGACGIILLDKPVAEEVIRSMTHSQQDELAVLTLGHECPHPASCCKALRFPAQASSSEGQVLLAGCIHNLGARKVTATMREGPAVNVTAMVQCSFHSFSDEFTTSPTWQDVTASPVKVLTDLFRQSGVPLPSVQPWARSFTYKGKPSTPGQCDAVQFNAMIFKDQLRQVLRASGHHGVYVVPRDDQGQLLPGWSVVWLSGSKRWGFLSRSGLSGPVTDLA